MVTQEQATGAAPTNETALVELLHQSTDGTTTTTNVSSEKIDQDRAETIQCTAAVMTTTEPTTNKLINGEPINPAMGGAFSWQANRESEYIPVRGGQAIGVRITPTYAAGSRNYRAKFIFEE